MVKRVGGVKRLETTVLVTQWGSLPHGKASVVWHRIAWNRYPGCFVDIIPRAK